MVIVTSQTHTQACTTCTSASCHLLRMNFKQMQATRRNIDFSSRLLCTEQCLCLHAAGAGVDCYTNTLAPRNPTPLDTDRQALCHVSRHCHSAESIKVVRGLPEQAQTGEQVCSSSLQQAEPAEGATAGNAAVAAGSPRAPRKVTAISSITAAVLAAAAGRCDAVIAAATAAAQSGGGGAAAVGASRGACAADASAVSPQRAAAATDCAAACAVAAAFIAPAAASTTSSTE